jgi:hypothetical protein
VSEANALKFVEAAVLLAALALFVWWQLRDLKKAAADTARKRAQDEAPETRKGET